MSLSPALIAAARRYGRTVDPIAAKYGISGAALLEKLIQGESGGRGDAVSSAGAQGYTQFMPGTRQIAVQKYGVDPLAGPDPAVHAAALHLRGLLTGSQGLEGYNPGGGQKYVSYILGQKVGDTSGLAPVSRVGTVDETGQRLTPPASPGQASFDAGAPTDTTGVLQALLGQQRAPAPVSVPDPPSSGRSYLRMGQTPVFNAQQPQASNVGALLDALRPQGNALPDSPVQATPTVSEAPQGSQAAPQARQRGGIAEFDGKPVSAWIAPILSYARQHGWKGTVSSGYRSDAEQKRIYDSGVRPAAVPKAYGGGGSNHSRLGFLQGAVDVTDPETLARILKAKGSRLQWAGSRDPVHFSVPRNGSY